MQMQLKSERQRKQDQPSSLNFRVRGPKRTHQIFRHCHRSQFRAEKLDGTGESRKYKSMRLRMAKIAKCLSRFDHSGHCASITASCTTILRTLRALEDRYSGKDRQKWSRPTLFRYLKLTGKAGGCETRRRQAMVFGMLDATAQFALFFFAAPRI